MSSILPMKVLGEIVVISNTKRTVVAIFISALGCVLTYVWHLKNEPQLFADAESDVIAYIARTKEQAHRKGVKTSLWEPAEKLDRLRVGDSVRTSEDSEVRIKFYQSDRYIDLDADSMIVIQKIKSEIILELLEGSAFVHQDKNNKLDPNALKNTLTLKSQDCKVDITNTESQLSTTPNGPVDLEILNGKVPQQPQQQLTKTNELNKNCKKAVQIIAGKIKIITPDYTKPVYTNALAPTPITLQWSGFPAKSQVLLESGSSRKKLKAQPAHSSSENNMQVLWKPGIHYWKLVATDTQASKTRIESAIYKTEVIGRYPPTPINPEPNFSLLSRHQTETITLQWNTPPETKDVLIELQNDETKQILFNQKISTSINSQEIPHLPLGSYSWRLTAYPHDGSAALQSPYYSFSIHEKKIIKIPITWNQNLKTDQFFTNSEPKISLLWTAESTAPITKWKVHIAAEGSDLNTSTPVETIQTQFEKNLSKPGRYLAYVAAYDKHGDNIGTSEVKQFNIQELPLLIAPKFLPNDTTELIAKPDGSVQLRWAPIESAALYSINVNSINENETQKKLITQQNSKNNFLNLNNLMPGLYKVQIKTIDQFGRSSQIAEQRTLKVPDKSEVKAPTLKRIKVN